MQWFFDRISTKFYPVSFGYSYQKQFAHDFDTLKSHGLIIHSSNLNEIDCDLCEEDHTTPIRQENNKLFIVCEYGCGTRDIQNQELAIYEYKIEKLLLLFQIALGIDSPKVVENIHGLLWNFGIQQINGINYHLFFTNDIDQIDRANLSIITALHQSVLFYTGTIHRSLPEDILLIPLTEIIETVTKNGIQLNTELIEKNFPTDAYPTKEGVIYLDKTMVLQGNAILSEPKRGSIFKKSTKISPLQKRIIERLYQIRKYDKNSMTLGELATALSTTSRKKGNKVSISNQIKGIKDICTENNLKQILYKFDDEKWGINPHLDCCK